MGRGEEISALRKRLRALERKVDFLMAHLQLDYQEEPKTGITQELIDLVQMGRKIEAIKRYREMTGAGLREAKEAIEAL